MMRNEVYILSQPIRSGKTGTLLYWITNRDVCGILTPDLDGIRHVLNVGSGDFFSLETNPGDNSDDHVLVGNFIFSSNAFQKARQLLKKSFESNHKFVLVDEVGKLELRGEGLEPGLKALIRTFREEHADRTLILVVRNTLLQEVIAAYDLRSAKIVDTTFFQ